MSKFDVPMSIPIKPSMMVKGIEPSSCTLFQSAMCPLKLDFYTVQSTEEERAHSNKKNPAHSLPP